MEIFLLIVAVLIVLVIIGKLRGDARSNTSLSPQDELKNIYLAAKDRNDLLNTIKRLEAGDTYASWLIGGYYESGKIDTLDEESHFPKDKAKALWWKLKSAEDGCGEAQFDLGHMYDWGDGLTDNLVEKDYGEAFKWFSRAAENGEFNSLAALGELYYQGHGVAQDYQKAFECFSRSIDHPTAKKFGAYGAGLRIGMMYAAGNGVGQDFVQAYKWMTIAGIYPDEYWECPLKEKLSTEEKERAKLMAKEWSDSKQLNRSGSH